MYTDNTHACSRSTMNFECHKTGQVWSLVSNDHHIAQEWNLSQNVGFQNYRRDILTTSSDYELCRSIAVGIYRVLAIITVMQ